jgi:hypothetical protein
VLTGSLLPEKDIEVNQVDREEPAVTKQFVMKKICADVKLCGTGLVKPRWKSTTGSAGVFPLKCAEIVCDFQVSLIGASNSTFFCNRSAAATSSMSN